MADLIEIKGGGSPDKLAEELRLMEQKEPYITRYQPIYAKMVRARYDALLTQGFTEAQALELCRGLT